MPKRPHLIPHARAWRTLSSPHSRVVLLTRREYHDESFGFRKPREYVFPDCVLHLLDILNDSNNAPQTRKLSCRIEPQMPLY